METPYFTSEVKRSHESRGHRENVIEDIMAEIV